MQQHKLLSERSKLKSKVSDKLSEWKEGKVVNFEVPMFIGCVVASLIFVSCESKAIEVTDSPAQCEWITKHNLSPYQLEVARKSYLHGQEKDLGYTLIAINWKESKLGLHKVRLQDGKYGSYGVSHIFLDYPTKGWNNWQRNKYAEKLMLNDDFAIQEGLNNLSYWQSHKATWFESVAAYNSGWNGGESYARDVANTVRQIMKCDFI